MSLISVRTASSLGSSPPFPPSSPPHHEANTAAWPQPRHVRNRHLLLPSDSSSLENHVCNSSGCGTPLAKRFRIGLR